MSNAARGRAPAHLNAKKIWSLMDDALLSVSEIEGALEVMTLAASSVLVPLETRHAIEFIRDGIRRQLGELQCCVETAMNLSQNAGGLPGGSA